MTANVFQPGDPCGPVRVVRLVGAGGFSEVYEVVDRRGRRRALKVIAAEEASAAKLRARLAQEGEVLARIDHVNVVRFYDAGMHGSHAWLLLELIDGQNLREALQARAAEPSVGDESIDEDGPLRVPVEV